MNDDLNVINNLFVEDILGSFGKELGRSFAHLKEYASDAKLKKVNMLDIPFLLPQAIVLMREKIKIG